MFNLTEQVKNFINHCVCSKRLSANTIKSYSIDLLQYVVFSEGDFSKNCLSKYIAKLHQSYKPKTVKRKIACLKTFANYLLYEEIIDASPFAKIKTSFKEPFVLPKTIPLDVIKNLLSCAYNGLEKSDLTTYRRKEILRDIAVLELLFGTGARVSEICSLKGNCVDIVNRTVKFFGKGSRERIIQIENANVLKALDAYYRSFKDEITGKGFFFINRFHNRLSEQSVRFMIKKYAGLIEHSCHITPHMFRHSFATLLLEEDVDIRYIQKILGHSSITTTEIYTHVTSSKQKEILATRHPRNKIEIE
jgi:integrase/recombinase XerD